MDNIALFPGSFNPFTIGHKDIVKRALQMFDEVIICVSYNNEKVRLGNISQAEMDARVKQIKEIFKNNINVSVISSYELTYKVAQQHNCSVIIRGVRSCKDFEYEYEMAQVNKKFGNIETILLPSDPSLSFVSSSAIRTLSSSDTLSDKEKEHINKYIAR